MSARRRASALRLYVGARIRDHRGALTQAKVAAGIGTSPNMISRWETGIYGPGLDDLDKLAAFFGIPVEAFFPPARSKDPVERLRDAARELSAALAEAHPTRRPTPEATP